MGRGKGDGEFRQEGGGEAPGYNEYLAGGDPIVIGRKGFEKVFTVGALSLCRQALWIQHLYVDGGITIQCPAAGRFGRTGLVQEPVSGRLEINVANVMLA